MIPRKIHQVFWSFTASGAEGKELNDIPKFKEYTTKTQQFANHYGYEYKLWSLKDCEEFLKLLSKIVSGLETLSLAKASSCGPSANVTKPPALSICQTNVTPYPFKNNLAARGGFLRFFLPG